MTQPAAGLRVALAQINPTVGDIDGNAALIAERIARARELGAALVVLPELCLPGYPAEDLYLKRHFIDANARGARGAGRRRRAGSSALVGFSEPASSAVRRGDAPAPRRRTTRSRCSPRARSAPSTARTSCPTTGSSTSVRYFEPGHRAARLIEVAGALVGLTICEDIWVGGPAGVRGGGGGRAADRQPLRLAVPARQGRRARGDVRRPGPRDWAAAFAFCNLVGGQDELVFDGHSFVVGADGEVIARAPQFEPALLVFEPAEARGLRRGSPASLARPRPRSTRRCGSASATTSTKNGFERGAGRALGRDRLGAGRAAGRRRARPRAAGAAWSCPRPTPAPRPRPTRARSPPTSAPS